MSAGLGEPAERDRLEVFGSEHRVPGDQRGQRGVGDAGRHAVYPDVVPGQVDGGGPDQGPDRRLGDVVDGVGLLDEPGVDRGVQMIAPPPGPIARAASTTQCMVPSTLTAMCRRQCSSVISSSASGSAMPACAHITSIRPNSAVHSSTARRSRRGRTHRRPRRRTAGRVRRRPRQAATVPVERDYPGSLVQESGHDPEADALRGAGDDDAWPSNRCHDESPPGRRAAC